MVTLYKSRKTMLKVKFVCHLVIFVLHLLKINFKIMKTKYLFPSRYKKLGWIILVPTFIFGIISFSLGGYSPDFLTIKVPSLFINEVFGESRLFGLVENNIMDEILCILLILSSLLVAFSKEKLEDEYIANIRLESLVWAVYVNYAILLLTVIVFYGLTFWWVMIINMFTVLWFFIIRFNWQLMKLKKSESHVE